MSHHRARASRERELPLSRARARPDRPATSATEGIARRDFLVASGAAAGGAMIAGCAPRPARAPLAPRFEQPIIVDIHCHDFNASDLPITGFVARIIPGLTEMTRSLSRLPELILRRVVGAIHGLLNVAAPTADEETSVLQAVMARPDAGAPAVAPIAPFDVPVGPIDDLAHEIARLFPVDAPALRERLVALAQTLYLVGHGRAQLAATLATSYPRVALFTPLLVDFDAWSDDRPQSPLAAQIAPQALVARLAMRGRVGRPDARFHPFVAFDPLREAQGGGALALARQAVDGSGFLGVKLYPPVGFLPIGNAGAGGDRARGAALDAALRALYATCAADDIPLTAHASPSNQFALGFGELAAPARWTTVLREFPSLRLNFGHFGHETGADGGPSAGAGAGAAVPAGWMYQAAELIAAYPNVYADLSGSPLVFDAGYAARFGASLKALCARFPRLPARLMFGSDWWLNRFDPSGPTPMVEAYERWLDAWLGAEARAAIMGRNALRFLGFLDDDDRLTTGNRNRQRLRGFYRQDPLPAWLGHTQPR